MYTEALYIAKHSGSGFYGSPAKQEAVFLDIFRK